MISELKQAFKRLFNDLPEHYIDCGGRFEVMGNHTDHNHGLCIAATCSLTTCSAIKKNNDNNILIYSEGFGEIKLDLTCLEKKEDEVGKSEALIRGIASYIKERGCKVGGFTAYIKSTVPPGAGVSSSAAFELLIGQIFNTLFNDNKVEKLLLCKAGQFAERNYYGKMCGLLDQIGVAYGGLVYIDFADIDNPIVKTLEFDSENYQFLIVNSGGSHADLSDLYSAIPADMYKVANHFNENFLHDVDNNKVLANKEAVIANCGQNPFDRSQHFYGECERVTKAYEAVEHGNMKELINQINGSRISSTNLLKNMYVKEIAGSPLEACNIIMESSLGEAGVKINGGGFAGTVIALVPKTRLDAVIKATSEKYGEHNVHLVNVRNMGPGEIVE